MEARLGILPCSISGSMTRQSAASHPTRRTLPASGSSVAIGSQIRRRTKTGLRAVSGCFLALGADSAGAQCEQTESERNKSDRLRHCARSSGCDPEVRSGLVCPAPHLHRAAQEGWIVVVADVEISVVEAVGQAEAESRKPADRGSVRAVPIPDLASDVSPRTAACRRPNQARVDQISEPEN